MTTDKAREFFSAYYEGSLEEGLKQSLEQAISRDSNLREEYDLFADTVRELEHLGDAEIPIPFDLHDRIVSRIEEGTKKKALPPLVLWRNLAYSAVAATLIIGSVIGLKNKLDGGPSIGSLAGGAGQVAVQNTTVKPVVKYDGTNVTVTVLSEVESKALRVESAPDGKSLRVATLVPNQVLEAPLSNPQTDAKAFRVKILDQSNDLIVALPGTSPDGRLTGDGTAIEFVLALAGHYRAPVVLQGSLAGEKMKWDFANLKVSDAVKNAFGQVSPAMQVMDSGLVHIGE